ncbi:MAG TPA: gliding motility protein GldM [Bacteroidales bacterium]|jgi:gliding motility-associated protein GldM|nr:gliding motility protein GldM [Bacteroidales bacterium]
MAHGKETPRQKMIGMMYLVLTALLALNVSKSVLDAFLIIDEGLEKTGVTMENKNKEIYSEFELQNSINPSKTAIWLDRANQVRERTQKLYDYIQDLKLKTLNEAERGKSAAITGKSIDRDKIEATDNYDTPHRIMIGNELNDKSEARILKNEIASLREFMLTLVKEKELPEQLRISIEKSLTTDPPVKKTRKSDPETQSWEYHKFGHSPLLGFIAIMSSMQIDLRNAESEMINYLYAQISAGEVKFNELEAVVIPNSNYVIRGNPYKANIFLAARDTTQAPKILVVEGMKEPWTESTDPVSGAKTYSRRDGLNYRELPVERGTGKGIYEMPGNSIGQRTWGGIIEITGPGGEPIIRPFSSEYMVAEGSVAVSPTKMNVFYLAVDNPVDISVSGVAGNKIRASATNGVLEPRGNSYNITPRRIGNCMITVSAEIDGKWTSVGTKEFRVKAVPDPVATVGGQKGGIMAKNILMAQAGIMATMPPDFEFDLKFNVTQYTVGTVVQGFLQERPVRGASFNQEIRNLINNVPRGNQVTINEIKAVGPDGSVRDLNSIILKVN